MCLSDDYSVCIFPSILSFMMFVLCSTVRANCLLNLLATCVGVVIVLHLNVICGLCWFSVS